MKKINSNVIGIDQGEETLFSDFENGGDMWTGEGSRERRATVRFSERFREPPNVMVSVSLEQSKRPKTSENCDHNFPLCSLVCLSVNYRRCVRTVYVFLHNTAWC